MEVIDLPLAGLKLIRPRVFRDERGFFVESYQRERYRASGIDCEFVQDNHSRSLRGTLRGLHYCAPPGQARLIRVTSGRIFDVAVDLRYDSPTLGRWHGVEVDAEEHAQFFIPPGFAHGFCVLSDAADVVYKTSTAYDGAGERGIRWDDPDLRIEWPVKAPLLSPRDASLESFGDFARRLVGR